MHQKRARSGSGGSGNTHNTHPPNGPPLIWSRPCTVCTFVLASSFPALGGEWGVAFQSGAAVWGALGPIMTCPRTVLVLSFLCTLRGRGSHWCPTSHGESDWDSPAIELGRFLGAGAQKQWERERDMEKRANFETRLVSSRNQGGSDMLHFVAIRPGGFWQLPDCITMLGLPIQQRVSGVQSGNR